MNHVGMRERECDERTPAPGSVRGGSLALRSLALFRVVAAGPDPGLRLLLLLPDRMVRMIAERRQIRIAVCLLGKPEVGQDQLLELRAGVRARLSLGLCVHVRCLDPVVIPRGHWRPYVRRHALDLPMMSERNRSGGTAEKIQVCSAGIPLPP